MAKMRRYNTRSQKLDTATVKEMYQRLKDRELTQGEAARIYRLGVIQVGRIARGESRAAETGANEDPLPNFNLQIPAGQVQRSADNLLKRLEAGEGMRLAASLYNSPPPTTDEDNAALERASDRLQQLTETPKSIGVKVREGLDDLDSMNEQTKGD